MYEVPPQLWISVVEMYMEGPASRWYQSLAPQLPYLTWDSFCRLLRDQHEALLCQLFNIRQHTTISAYLKAFSELVDQLTSYSPVHDPLYFTIRFINGLRPDIKAIVIMQRPRDFHTACRLALLQEEVVPMLALKPSRGGDWYASFKPRPPAMTPMPLPPPPPRGDKLPVNFAAKPPPPESSLSALKAYRRALGLCFKCGVKWSKDHQCALEVIFAVEAVWSALPEDEPVEPESPTSPEEPVA